MSGPLLTPDQLAAVQQTALRGMVTPIRIYRRTLADSAYGDDDAVTYTLLGTTTGWVFSKPTRELNEDVGSLITDNTYRLFLPIGTDILPGDQVEIDSAFFIIVDTTRESTWPALLGVSMRRRE